MRIVIMMLLVALGINLEAQETITTYHPQGIIIIIDRKNEDFISAQENKFDSIPVLTSELFYALLANEKTPILVSKSLLSTFISWYLLQKDANLKRKVLALKRSLIIKECEDFFLLVRTSWESQDNSGLQLQSLKDSSWGKAATFIPPNEPNNTPIQDIFSKIFLNKNSLEKSKLTVLPSWMVYLSGHGDSEDMISGLSVEEFKNLTRFLKNQLFTKIFIYGSCYAGGLHKIKAFQSSYTPLPAAGKAFLYQETFPFPIVLLSVAETQIITNLASSFTDLDKAYKYDFIFEKLAQNDIPDYYTIFKEGNFLTSPKEDVAGRPDILETQFPQIRFPNTEWFSIESRNSLKNNKEYGVISKVEAETREKPLTIAETVKSIFVYSQKIPFKITIKHVSGSRIPRIVPMDFINQIHFSELDLENLNFEGLCRLLMPLEKSLKLSYFIDLLKFKSNDKEIVLKNCYFVSYLAQDEKKFKFSLFGQDVTSTQIMHYQAQIEHTENINELYLSTIPLTIFEPKVHKGILPAVLPEHLIFEPIGKKIQNILKTKAKKIE